MYHITAAHAEDPSQRPLSLLGTELFLCLCVFVCSALSWQDRSTAEQLEVSHLSCTMIVFVEEYVQGKPEGILTSIPSDPGVPEGPGGPGGPCGPGGPL